MQQAFWQAGFFEDAGQDDATADRMRQRTNWGNVLKPKWHDGKDLGFPRPPIDPPIDENAPGNDQ